MYSSTFERQKFCSSHTILYLCAQPYRPLSVEDLHHSSLYESSSSSHPYTCVPDLECRGSRSVVIFNLGIWVELRDHWLTRKWGFVRHCRYTQGVLSPFSEPSICRSSLALLSPLSRFRMIIIPLPPSSPSQQFPPFHLPGDTIRTSLFTNNDLPNSLIQ
jgi:hypothetical protein